MNKLKKFLPYAVVATLILSPMNVFAANGDLWKDGKLAYTAKAIQVTPSLQKMLQLAPNGYAYEIDGKAYNLTDVNTSYAANAKDLAATLAAVPTDYTPVIEDVTEEQELVVESVSAINATQVKVVFSQEVAAGTAANQSEVLATYSLGGANPSDAVLQADNKTVILTFTAAEVQVTNAPFLVSPVASKADATVLSTQYAGLFTAKDTTAPAIEKITCVTNLATATSVTVDFTEPVSSLGTVKIDGNVVGPTGFVAGDDSAVFNGLSLDATTTHTIQIVGLKDMAPAPGNVAGVLSSIFSVVKDTVAPDATLSAKGDHTILVTFDKEMDPLTVVAGLPAGTTVVKDEILGNITSLVAAVVPNTDNKQFTIDVSTSLYGSKASRTLTVVFPATITDNLGNKMAATTKQITLTKDAVAPTLTSASFNKDSATGNVTAIVVNTSEGLPATTVTPGAGNVTIVDKDGVLVPVTSFLGGINAYTPAAGDTKLVFSVTTPAKMSGEYTFTFARGFVNDMAQTPNTSAAATFTIDFGAPTPSTGTFTIPSTSYTPATALQPTATANVFTLAFGTAVKGGTVAGSATNLANYSINGAALPAGTTITLDTVSAPTTATITLPVGSVAKTDTAAVFYVSGVQDSTGNTVVPLTTTVQVNDNTAPVLTSATLNADNTISLGFSETVTGLVAADLVVKVNGATMTLPAGATLTAGTGSDSGKWVLDMNSVKYSAPNSFVNMDGTGTYNPATDILLSSTSDVTAGWKYSTSPVITSLSVGTASTGITGADAATNTVKTNTTITLK